MINTSRFIQKPVENQELIRIINSELSNDGGGYEILDSKDDNSNNGTNSACDNANVTRVGNTVQEKHDRDKYRTNNKEQDISTDNDKQHGKNNYNTLKVLLPCLQAYSSDIGGLYSKQFDTALSLRVLQAYTRDVGRGVDRTTYDYIFNAKK